jgi:tetratricopeptide (TPR) repeat protein
MSVAAKLYNEALLASTFNHDVPKSIKLFKKVIELDNRFYKAFVGLGTSLCQTGQFEAGIQAYRSSLSICPTDVVTHINLGNALRNTGQYAESLTVFDSGLGICEDTEIKGILLIQKSFTLKDMGNREDAVRVFEHGEVLNPKYACC